MNLSEAAMQAGETLKSAVKIALQSRRATIKSEKREGAVIIMGNGPSLRDTLDGEKAALSTHPLMAVNFAATAPEFRDLKPEYYVLADPFFFGDSNAANLRQLKEALKGVDWAMTLIVPVAYRRRVPAEATGNPHVTVATINTVGAEGYGWFEDAVYGQRLAMPRPRNVLIPSIMSAMWLGYRTIYIVGADHSWMETISVNGANEVVSVQPHFYKEAEGEQKRVDTTYRGLRLHEVVRSFYIAFKSYHDIARYARKKGVAIYNASAKSMIDAFARARLPE